MSYSDTQGPSLLRVKLTSVCLALALFSFVSTPTAQAQANRGVIAGIVTDAEGGNPLPGATAYVGAVGRGAAADRNGRFRIEGVPAGTYEIVVQYIGRNAVRESVIVTANETASLDVSLSLIAVGLDAVVVSASPIVGSQAAAISYQKAAPVVVNVVASDMVGKFPDQNAAAALSRVPGIAVQRDQGQARYINLRGAPSRWTTLAFDGVNVIGSEGRIVRFDEIPAPIIQTIEVTKAISPDLPAESVAGRINVITASAFDRPGFRVAAEAAPGYFELGNDLQYNAFAQVSNTWGSKFGVTATASRYRRNQVTDNIESDYELGPGDGLFPTNADFRVYYLERTNNAFSGRLDFRPSGDHELFATSTFVEFNDNEQRNQYIFNLEDGAGFMEGNNTPDQGQLQAVPMRQLLGPGYYRNSTWNNIVGGTSRFGDWTADYRASYTKTNAELDLPLFFLIDAFPFVNVAYDFSDIDQPDIQLTDDTGAALTTIDQVGPEVELGLIVDGDEDADAYSGQLDLRRSLDLFGTPSTIKFGGKFDIRDKAGYQFAVATVPVGPLLEAIAASPIDYSQFLLDEQLEGEFPFGNRYNVQRFDIYGLEDELAARLVELETAGLYDPASVIPDDSRFDVEEAIFAGYIMNTWETGFGSVLAGARLESAQYESSGFQVVDDVSTPVSVSTDELFLFPSLHVNIDLSESSKLRFAGTSTVSRADFNSRRPGASIDDTNGLIIGGNPQIKSERSWGLDARYEYYLPRTGLISVAAFGKWIDDPLFTTTTIIEDDAFDNGAIDRTGYIFAAPANGTDGEVFGVELDYFQQWDFLPGALGGLGLQANATLLTSDFTTPTGASGVFRSTAFPGTSDAVYNLSLFFERYGLSARLSYQWRDAWLDEVDSDDERFDGYWDSESRLDLSVRYAVSSQLTIFADANNLTDELGKRYLGRVSRPAEIEGFGRRYLFGVRVNF